MRSWRRKKRSSRRAAASRRSFRIGARQGLRVGFTNGCFDILHPGHVKVLTAARGACDRLIVGLNSDASVKRLKGEARPVQDERARAEVLAALEAVDLVVVFEEDTPIRLITAIKPSVLVKGGDYTRDQVVGHEIVEAARRRSAAGRCVARFLHDLAGQSRAWRQGVSATVEASMAGSMWRSVAGSGRLGDHGRYFRHPARSFAAMVDVAGGDFCGALLISMAPFLDVRAFLQSLRRPICALPIALFALAAVGTLWSDAPWGARLYAIGPIAKLLVLPVLFYHFERSARGMWVLIAFLYPACC